MYRRILDIRYHRWTGRHISWDSPANLQEYVLSQLDRAARDPARLRHLGMLADKINVRDYVAARVGDDCIPRLYGTWRRPDDIDWDALPDRYVLKTNNGCGTNIVVRDSSAVDRRQACRQLRRWLAFPYGELSGQIHYAAIEPMILAEELLEDQTCPGALPNDYKIFCFNGHPELILYYEDRKVNGHLTPNMAYTTGWEPRPDIVLRPTRALRGAPRSLSEMVEKAARLSRGLKFARVDFYDIDGKCYFGEVTLTPDVCINFTPEFLKNAMSEFNLV